MKVGVSLIDDLWYEGLKRRHIDQWLVFRVIQRIVLWNNFAIFRQLCGPDFSGGSTLFLEVFLSEIAPHALLEHGHVQAMSLTFLSQTHVEIEGCGLLAVVFEVQLHVPYTIGIVQLILVFFLNL